MLWFYCVCFCFIFCLCGGEEGDVGYSLKIGHAIDVFANYGDLCLVTQVISADAEEEDSEEIPAEPFREKNIRIFERPLTIERRGRMMDTNINIILCDTFQDLLDYYFQDFSIEGTTKPWRAFMGDWIPEEIMRTLGIPIDYDRTLENCCHVLVKLSKTHRSVKMAEPTAPVEVRQYVRRAMGKLDITQESDIRKFMKNYGTHYIHSYVTGNFVYQVFKFKRAGYHLLKEYMRRRRKTQMSADDLRFYFSSFFLKNVGDIRIASGNKTTEAWARDNLKDGQYLYSRPSIMRLNYNPTLVSKLNDLLDNSALIALNLKTLKPIFENQTMGERFVEVVQNDLLLWEVNG